MTTWGNDYQPTVCVDFDGVLAQYDGWHDDPTWIGDPIPGGAAFTRMLMDKGYRVVVLTARELLTPVEEWLYSHGFPAMEVTNRKVPAQAYIDDRSVRFTGDWSGMLEAIAQPPHWERD